MLLSSWNNSWGLEERENSKLCPWQWVLDSGGEAMLLLTYLEQALPVWIRFWNNIVLAIGVRPCLEQQERKKLQEKTFESDAQFNDAITSLFERARARVLCSRLMFQLFQEQSKMMPVWKKHKNQRKHNNFFVVFLFPLSENKLKMTWMKLNKWMGMKWMNEWYIEDKKKHYLLFWL